MDPIKTLLLTGGRIHDWAGCGQEILTHLTADGGFDVTWVKDDLDALVAPGLDPYDLPVFYYTVGEITDSQKLGLLNWVASGKGYAGVHSAADSFRGCPGYRALVGGHFVTHPRYREYQVQVSAVEHPITAGLSEFQVTDEQYIVSWDRRNTVLASALHQGEAAPVVWIKEWGQGRVCYLALGHNPDSCRAEVFGTLLTRGARWAATPPAGEA